MTVPAPPTRATHEAGFTLVEVMVAVLTGLVVTLALFTILEVAVRQTSRITDRVQATQQGRTAMTNIVSELRSACLAREFQPVQENSTSTAVIFTAAFGQGAVIEYKEVARHKIEWTGTVGNPGTAGNLIDYTYPATGGTWPDKFTFEEKEATPKSGVLVAQNVFDQLPPAETTRETELEKEKLRESLIFQYYKYSTEATPGNTEIGTKALEPIELKSGEKLGAQAKNVAAVKVIFSLAPADSEFHIKQPVSTAAAFESLTTFAFSAPAAEATITDGPCQ